MIPLYQDWLTPAQNLDAMRAVGWLSVKYLDLTPHIKISFELMLRKVQLITESGRYRGIGLQLLEAYGINLQRRITQVQAGVFQWGVITGRKARAFPAEEALRRDMSIAHKVGVV